MKVSEVRLPIGVKIEGGRIQPINTYVEPYVLKLLEPVDGIDSIEVMPSTLQDVIDAHVEANAEHSPDTEGYREAVFRAHLKRRATPVFTKQQLDNLTGPDDDALRRLLILGLGVDRKAAFTADEGVERNAYVRLHYLSDRKVAEGRIPTTRAENPTLYEAYLTWWITRFGYVTSESFEKKPGEFTDFVKIAWDDFMALTAAVVGRDYKEISEVLDGTTEADGKPLPFPGVLEDDATETPTAS